MVGVNTVVTRDARDVTREFADLVEDRDIGGLGFISVAGAAGVAVANEVVDMVLPSLGLNPDPQTARDFLGAGIVQLAFAGLVVTVAASVAATSPILFAGSVALALGSAIIGGANLFEWGQRQLARFSEAAPSGGRGTGNRGSASGSGRRRNPGSTGLLATRG